MTTNERLTANLLAAVKRGKRRGMPVTNWPIRDRAVLTAAVTAGLVRLENRPMATDATKTATFVVLANGR